MTFNFDVPDLSGIGSFGFQNSFGIIGELKCDRNNWKRFLELVKKYDPDLIGTQEVSRRWRIKIDEYFTNDYYIIGISRLGNKLESYENSDESNLLLVKKNRYDVIESNTFWLTKTPDVVSKITDSKYHRICTYALLYDKVLNQKVLFLNTHLDHEIDDFFRVKQVDIIVDFLSPYLNNNYKIILTGDFNSTVESKTYKIITEVLLDSNNPKVNKSKVNYTYHEYGNQKVYSLIDYCFLNNLSVKEYYIINDDFDGYVSDHYGILVKL